MSTYREATLHARAGGTISRAGRTIRLLTQEEANAHALIHNPSRSVVKDADGNAVVKNGQIVVETYGEAHPKALGLFDVSQSPPVSYVPAEDDILAPLEYDEEGNEKPRALRTDWMREGIDDVEPPAPEPEPVAPEVVDEVLAEQPELEDEPIIEDVPSTHE